MSLADPRSAAGGPARAALQGTVYRSWGSNIGAGPSNGQAGANTAFFPLVVCPAGTRTAVIACRKLHRVLYLYRGHKDTTTVVRSNRTCTAATTNVYAFVCVLAALEWWTTVQRLQWGLWRGSKRAGTSEHMTSKGDEK